METEFFGIVFRSPHHFQWFVSMTLTLLFIATTFVTVAQENDGLKKWKLRVMRAISVCFCIFYGAVSIGSVFDTNFGQRNGPVVSEDCIWFNGLLALAYLFFFARAHRLLARMK